jgi:hypothetical protein
MRGVRARRVLIVGLLAVAPSSISAPWPGFTEAAPKALAAGVFLPAGVFVSFAGTARDGHGFIEVKTDGSAVSGRVPVGIRLIPPLPLPKGPGSQASGDCALRLSRHVVRRLHRLIGLLPRPSKRLPVLSPDRFWYSGAYRLARREHILFLFGRNVSRESWPTLPRSSPLWNLVRYLKVILRNHVEHPSPKDCHPVRSSSPPHAAAVPRAGWLAAGQVVQARTARAHVVVPRLRGLPALAAECSLGERYLRLRWVGQRKVRRPIPGGCRPDPGTPGA